MTQIYQARQAVDNALLALQIEMWRGDHPANLVKVETPEASIALELERLAEGMEPEEKASMLILMESVTEAMIALFEARAALQNMASGQN